MTDSATSKISLFCLKTALGEKYEYGGVVKTTTHPSFQVDVEFGDSKKKKLFKCPYCGKEVPYKAFCYKFNLKKALKWPAIITGIGTALFLVSFLLIMGGLDIEKVMWYCGMWSIVAFILGVIFLIVQLLRHFFSYRKNRYRYVFIISEFSPNHILVNYKKTERWKKLRPMLP